MKYLPLLLLFSFIVIDFAAKSQEDAALQQQYKLEYQTFKEFIKNSETIKGDTNIDVKFYYIDIEVGITSPWIGGNVTVIFEPVQDNITSIDISLNSALNVSSVDGQASGFTQNNDVFEISLDDAYSPGEQVEVTIYYSGVPVMAGGYKGLRYESHGNNEPIIATLSTPYLAHYWFPCKDGPQDKPDSIYMDITIPDDVYNGLPLVAVSNGILENVINNGSTNTFQWRHRYPIVTYYTMVAISNYVSFEEIFTGTGGESFPLEYFVFEESFVSAEAGVAELPEAIQFFSDVFGTYPFAEEKYGMTQLGFYGAIENQTNTIQNNLSSGWFMTSVHELGHMWFGDMITLANWHHSWLNEGFATYSEALWQEHKYGTNSYHNYMEGKEFWGGGTLYLENAADTFNTFQSIFYNKGAYFLHMLRGVLGDDAFFDAVKNYATDPDYMYGNATTEDLQFSLENSSGVDLDFFFEQWIYDEYWPFYSYNFNQFSDNVAVVVLKQVQEQLYNYRPVFEMPVQLKFNFNDNTDTTITVWNNEQTQNFWFTFEKELSNVIVDPDKWILRKTLFNPDIPVGNEEMVFTDQLKVYPNPVKETFWIELAGYEKSFTVEVSGSNGNLLFSRDLKAGQNQIKLHEFSAGIYFYQIKSISGELLKSGKIIKY